jgi:hypothetical protein
MKVSALNTVFFAALGVGAVWLVSKIASLPKGALDPTSRQNILYQATGEVGLKLADRFPSAAERKVAEMLKSPTMVRAPAPYIGIPMTGFQGSGLVPAQMTSQELYNMTYGGALTGMGRWL